MPTQQYFFFIWKIWCLISSPTEQSSRNIYSSSILQEINWWIEKKVDFIRWYWSISNLEVTFNEFHRLGPGTYEVDVGSFNEAEVGRRANGPGWKRAYETMRLSQIPHLLYRLGNWKQFKKWSVNAMKLRILHSFLQATMGEKIGIKKKARSRNLQCW